MPQRWWLTVPDTDRFLVLGEEKAIGTLGSCFLPSHSTSSEMFSAQAKATVKNRGGRGSRGGIGHVQGACLPEAIPNHLPNRWLLGVPT